MAEALERLTVTRWEAWAGLLTELGLDVNRKLLSLRVSVRAPGMGFAAATCPVAPLSDT
jgi:hypothetical protein